MDKLDESEGSDEESTGMQAAYSIDDLVAALDSKNDNPSNDILGSIDTTDNDNPLNDIHGSMDTVTDNDNPSNLGSIDTTDNAESQKSQVIQNNIDAVETEGLYVCSKDVLERKRRSCSVESEEKSTIKELSLVKEGSPVKDRSPFKEVQDGSPHSPVKIISDISGRFQVDVANSNLNQSTAVASNGDKFETVYDEVLQEDDQEYENEERPVKKNVGHVDKNPLKKNIHGKAPIWKSVVGSLKSKFNQTKGDSKDEKVHHFSGGQDIYENIDSGGPGDDEDAGWASSEFEDYEDSVEICPEHQNHQQNGEDDGPSTAKCNSENEVELRKAKKPDKLSWKKRRQTSDIQSPLSASAMFDKITAKLSQQKLKAEEEEDDDESHILEDVNLSSLKHPPAELPETPGGLSTLQLKRRHVVRTIVESEKSYSSSLLRLVEDYEKPLLEIKPHIISKDAVKTIFYKIRDILHCHNMFQIELAEVVRLWDVDEKIGDVFTASFSKSIVFEVYSAFVNNFLLAIETAKKQARTKQGFADFLKQKLEASIDRLSLFGLMVKPVQRFPQFIMLLQDLLKYTPKDHHDRLSLQLALTELDTLTDRLNETKRESESKIEVKRLLANLTGRNSFKIDTESFLVRQDDIIQIKHKNGETKTKLRRMFLLSDQLICTSLVRRESDFPHVEKYAFVWSVPIKDIEVLDPTLPSSYKVHAVPGKMTISNEKSDKLLSPSEFNPYRKELDDMLHDLTLLESMSQLSAQLRLKYDSFSMDHLHGATKSLQLMIRQKCDVDKCLVNLSLPTKQMTMPTMSGDKLRNQVVRQFGKVSKANNVVVPCVRGNSRTNYTFQFDTSTIKHDWLLELHSVRLASDPRNHPAWYLLGEGTLSTKQPHFVQSLKLDITKEDNNNIKKLLSSKKKLKDKINCSVYVTLPSHDMPGIGIQHLWVCSGHKEKGQVSIISLHTNQPCIVESFRVCESMVLCAETVPGTSTQTENKWEYTDETVWMATDDNKIIICKVMEEDRSSKRSSIKVDHDVVGMRYLNSRMYVGLKTGHLLIYTRDQGGVWLVKQAEKISIGNNSISCFLPMERDMWMACDSTVNIISVSTSYNSKSNTRNNITKVCKTLANDCGRIECMVKAGVGLMVSFHEQSVIRLYHLETFDHLQDINTASAITQLLEGKLLSGSLKDDPKLSTLSITCMLSERGILWVGTNHGFVLTLPLPRLEGVPQVKRRPAVSYQAHVGPIRFLAAIHCGAAKLQTGDYQLDASFASAKTLENLDLSMASSDDELKPVKQGDEPMDLEENGSEGSIHAENVGNQNQWASMPDLQDLPNIDEDVSSLYENLLKGTNEDMDQVLTASPAVRQQSRGGAAATVVSNQVNKLSDLMRKSFKTQPRQSHRHSSIPAFNGNGCAKNAGHESNSAENGSYRVSRVESTDDVEAKSDMDEIESSQNGGIPSVYRRITIPSCPSMVASNLVHVPSSKALVFVSGGDGHVNWKDKKPFEKSDNDICLLLWQS